MAEARQGKSTSEDLYNGSSQTRVILAKPRLGGFGSSNFASSSNKSSNPFGCVLRPPQLKATSNPFYKHSEIPDDEDKGKEEQPKVDTAERLQDNKEEVKQPIFVPLGSAGATSRSSNPVPTPTQPTTIASSSSSFVFGQNLSERVVMAESVSNGEASSSVHTTSNGTAELLFTNAAASVKDNNQEGAGSSENSAEGLAAAAAEYERSHTRPPPLTTNCTMTGEEDEINVLQISCRLFQWESGSWRERGRGVLRLNDATDGNSGSNKGSGGCGSRLVVRVAGSLRVVLNTKLWPEMVVERAGEKSLRITAVDSQSQIKLFLIMGAPSDIIHLYKALITRVAESQKTSSYKQDSTSQRAAERLEASTEDYNYLDKLENNSDDDSSFEEEKQNYSELPEDKSDDGFSSTDALNENRLETDLKRETDDADLQKNNDMEEEKDINLLKRKEPADNKTPSKRVCPEIVIQRP